MTDSPTHGRRLFLAHALIIGACFLAYRNGFYREFIFDDVALIEQNPGIRGWNRMPAILGLGPNHVPTHRAIRNLSYALDYQFWRLNPFGYHLTNLTLHTLNALLVFSLAVTLSGSAGVALVAALLFALHPVQTEAVTYLSGRRDLLSSFFYLLAMDWYLSAHEGALTGRRQACIGVAYVLGCLSKELAVTLPAAIVAIEAFRAPRGTSLRGWVEATVARLRAHVFLNVFLWGFAGAFTLYVIKVHPYNLGAGTATPPLRTGLLTLAKVYAHYLSILVWPARLSMDYFPVSIVPSPGLANGPTLLAMAAVGLISMVGLSAFRIGHSAGLWAALAAIAFLPMSNLVVKINEPVAEHYLYLPLAFGAIALAAAGRSVLDAQPRLARVGPWVAGAILLALAGRTVLRNVDWQDPERLYSVSLQTFPRNSRLWNNLGAYRLGQDRAGEALADFDHAAALSPVEPKYHLNRADALRELGRLPESAQAARHALALDEDYGEAWVGLGRTLLIQKDLSGALHAMKKGLDLLGAGSWPALYWLGVAEGEAGRLPQAKDHLDQALTLAPRNPEANLQYAKVLIRLGDRAGALAHLTTACGSLPTSAVLLANRGDLLADMGQRDEALSCFQAMGQVNPQYAGEGHLRAARLLATMGRNSDASKELSEARAIGMDDRALARSLGLPALSAAVKGSGGEPSSPADQRPGMPGPGARPRSSQPPGVTSSSPRGVTDTKF